MGIEDGDEWSQMEIFLFTVEEKTMHSDAADATNDDEDSHDHGY